MTTRDFIKTTVVLVILTFSAANLSFAQNRNLPEPRQEKLLNGLKMLIWNEPASDKVTVKLRVHNGAAFDPKDKMGVMALLSDILFPTEEAKAYFKEELGGSLDITTNYDYIQISASGKAEQIQAILETLASVVTNPPITPDNFLLVRNARLEKIKELEKNPAYVADQAIAKRLFGDFPYGRSAEGTTESLAKIDKVDLMLARDRFFTADNATIAVIGNVKPDFVYRATRQLFGTWKKSDSKIPATFRLPDAPDTKEISIEIPNAEKHASRAAMVVPSRTDKDFYAAQILTGMWQKRHCLNDETYFGKSGYEPHLLRGVYVISKNITYGKEALPLNSSGCQLLLQKDGKFSYQALTNEDFEAVKKAVILDFQQQAQNNLADLWLDVNTYKLVSVKDEMTKLNNVTFADVQRLAESLQKQPVVSVIVKKSGETKQ
jgi:predicted Zn-dependent peptidase